MSSYSRRRALLTLAWSFVLVGCTTLAGLDDLHLDEHSADGDSGGGGGTLVDGVSPDTGPTSRPRGPHDLATAPNGTHYDRESADRDANGQPSLDAGSDATIDATSDATLGNTDAQAESGADATVDGGVIVNGSDAHVIELIEAGDADDDFCLVTGTCACNSASECRAGFDCCQHRCTDIVNDKDNCNGCGLGCTGNKICENSACGCGGLDPFCAAECVDYFQNPEHCGKCGHSCQGGECFGGACQPIELATDQQYPSGITADRNNVYFTNEKGNTIGRAPKQGPTCSGSQCMLFHSPSLDQPSGVTNDGANIYVTNYADGGVGNVVQVPTTMLVGAETVLASSKGPSAIVTAAGRVYWSSRDDSMMVGQVMVNGGIATAVATATGGATDTRALATDGISLVWGTRTPRPGVPVGVFHLSGAGVCTDATCTPTQTAGAGKPQSFFLFNDWLYWTSSDGTVRKMVKTGGCNNITPCPVILAENQPDPQTVVVDSSYVYWTNAGDGSVRHTPHYQRSCSGSRCQALAGGLGMVSGLAQDSTALYITSKTSGPPSSGVVWKLAK